MDITYEVAKDRLQKIVAEKGEDYVYTYDPKACEAAKARLEEIRLASPNPNATHWTVGGATKLDVNGNEYAVQCTYRNVDKTPGCIVGHFIYDLNPELVLDESGWSRELIDGTDITVDDKTSELLSLVQQHQDSGIPWGQALSKAIEYLEGVDE